MKQGQKEAIANMIKMKETVQECSQQMANAKQWGATMGKLCKTRKIYQEHLGELRIGDDQSDKPLTE